MTAVQPVLSALAHPVCREVWARIVLGEFDAPSSRQQEKALARLLAVGLVAQDPAGVCGPDGTPRYQDAGLFQDLLRQQGSAATSIEARYVRNGVVDRWPSKEEDKLALVRWILGQCLDPGEEIQEVELNERIRRWFHDPALVRRYGVDGGLLQRDPVTQVYRS